MHEWALAEAIINSAINIAQNKNLSKVESVLLRVGEIQQIDLDILSYAIKELSQGTLLENAHFKYKIHPAKIFCHNCGNLWDYSESFSKLQEEEKEAIHFIPETIHVYVRCPKCGSVDFEIKEGRGVWIEEIT